MARLLASRNKTRKNISYLTTLGHRDYRSAHCNLITDRRTVELNALLDTPVDARLKGFPHAAPAMRLGDVGAQGWNVLRGDLPFPVAIVRRSAMRHNSAWMRAFTQATGVAIAPHGKTTMCPQIFAQQLEDGAWGMTVANVHQLGICAALGVRRVVIANQVVARGDVARLVELMRAHADLWVCFLVD